MGEVIKIQNLYKSYGDKEVIKGISLTTYSGEVFGFLGKNGVGKSTTIDCMVGIKSFNKGEIFINGYSITKKPIEAKKTFGYVNSEPLCYETMTGREYLAFIASIYKIPNKDFKFYLNKYSLMFDIANDLDRLIKEYSHGMKQKISLIASVIFNPKLLILDEPTVGLDVMVANTLNNLILDLKRNNKGVFVTSHNIDFVKKVCDRVSIINNGRIVYLLDLDKRNDYRQNLENIFLSVYSK
ncbi:MAG: ABC transporter ATP-binding protein [Firmicutes bacterium]|uniref:ABC transporter ATP-binding protein n=1 Tax=Candidatus Onthovivens merdipullorum TaxID=2840889 RepID=A0A9D9DHF5_9BACL|nr:ABC transporter ATP-binding protein [Candidatus Onthovivens merdipullorum]